MVENKEIPIEYLKTAQEHVITGSTPHDTTNMYIPQGVLLGKYSLEEMIEERRRRKVFSTPLYIRELELRQTLDDLVIFDFAEIDKQTGETLVDPSVTGILRESAEEPEVIEDRDLASEIYSLYPARVEKLGLRPTYVDSNQHKLFL